MDSTWGITEFEPNKKLSIKSTSGSMQYKASYIFESTDEGTRIPMELSTGDRVIYSKFAGTEYKDGDEEYLILRESDILAKIATGEKWGRKPRKK